LTSMAPAAPDSASSLSLEFDDNRLMTALCGAHDEHLARLEQRLGVSVHARGNRLTISGTPDTAESARRAITLLYDRLKAGRDVDRAEVDAAVRLAQGGEAPEPGGRVAGTDLVIKTPKRPVAARSPGQEVYIRALQEAELVFGLGPAGTGKTYLAVAMGVALMQAGHVERLILSRPAVEAGERLGFLPGDLREKVDPYLRPLYDALYDMLPAERVVRRLESGEIEVAPLAFMRGRTLSNAFIILDEAQNTTPMQMKMLLTRMGENSRMVVTGDLSQVDLPRGMASGLHDALDVLQGVEGVRFVRFARSDVVRHDLVSRIVHAYEAREGEQPELDLTGAAVPAPEEAAE
jgi:phosphate starvation-inducible PhoH-like protein